ncbi:hypothetical protein ACJJI5_05560 [Microbulbifer sp. EKSA008]|uniref:hypothetical protein n=1 Tax=unclassified Microbulbifer TaxID=2619833 RepID=UPI004039E954
MALLQRNRGIITKLSSGDAIVNSCLRGHYLIVVAVKLCCFNVIIVTNLSLIY